MQASKHLTKAAAAIAAAMSEMAQRFANTGTGAVRLFFHHITEYLKAVAIEVFRCHSFARRDTSQKHGARNRRSKHPVCVT